MMQSPDHGTDVHFDIVRLLAPPTFISEVSEIRFNNEKDSYSGPGSITASLTELSGRITLGVLNFAEAVNGRSSTPGRLITDAEFATVTPLDFATPSWIAEGGYVTSRAVSSEAVGQIVSFMLTRVSLQFAVGEAAYTREIYRGPRLEWLRQYTLTDEGGARLDRVEGRALGRRTTIRDLRTGPDANDNTIAIVYDGSPHIESDADALWLGVSLLAGQPLQSAITETYDAFGVLLSRTFSLGNSAKGAADPPFDLFYAPFDPRWLESVIDPIAERLRENFPIDVVIAHLQDATDGSMERRMQSYLLALHAASEAWARSNGSRTVFPRETWLVAAAQMADAALTKIDWLSRDMQEVIRAKIRDANNVGTAARIKEFYAAIGVVFDGDDKKAVSLRNVLCHDGYLQRRFKELSAEERQTRFDQMRRLRDFGFRTLFALLDFEGAFQSALDPRKSIVSRNQVTSCDPNARTGPSIDLRSQPASDAPH